MCCVHPVTSARGKSVREPAVCEQQNLVEESAGGREGGREGCYAQDKDI